MSVYWDFFMGNVGVNVNEVGHLSGSRMQKIKSSRRTRQTL